MEQLRLIGNVYNLKWDAVIRYLTAAFALVFLFVFLHWLSPAVTFENFKNEDAVRIVYGADLLERGQFPMIQSVELKPPGCSFLARFIWAVKGRSLRALENFSRGWAFLSICGVFTLGWLLYGVGSGFVFGLVYLLGAEALGGTSFNYVSCMLPFLLWSTVFFLQGVNQESRFALVVSGLLLAFSACCYRPTIVLIIGYALLIAFQNRLSPCKGKNRESRRRELLFWGGGVVLGFLPILCAYAIKGGMGDFLHQYFFSKEAWLSVIGEGERATRLDRLLDSGLTGFWELLAVPSLLACMGISAWSLGQGSRRVSFSGAVLLVNVLAGLFVFCLGFEFQSQDYLVLLVALAWLAALPQGPILRWRVHWPGGWRAALGRGCLFVCLALALTPAILKQAHTIESRRKREKHPETIYAEIEQAGKIIQKEVPPSSTVWIWGDETLALYYFSQRKAASKYYSPIEFVTTPLESSWHNEVSPYFIRRGPYQKIATDLRKNKPAMIVLEKRIRYDGWVDFEQLLARAYEPYQKRTFSTFSLYKLKTSPKNNRKEIP